MANEISQYLLQGKRLSQIAMYHGFSLIHNYILKNKKGQVD